jgi:hypothetical protein
MWRLGFLSRLVGLCTCGVGGCVGRHRAWLAFDLRVYRRSIERSYEHPSYAMEIRSLLACPVSRLWIAAPVARRRFA